MSGGSWEYVMGNYAPAGQKYSGNKTLNNSGYTGLLLDGSKYTGKNWLEDKYYDFYTSSDLLTACKGKACISQALNETEGWYGDYMQMISSQWPWGRRSGNYAIGEEAGIFYFYRLGGDEATEIAFRLVLSSS